MILLHKALRIIYLCLPLIFAACGGGGGAKSGGNSGSTTTSGQSTISTNEITFSAELFDGTAPSEQVVSGSVTGATGPVYIYIDLGNSKIIEYVEATSSSVTFFPAAPLDIGPGSHSEQVSVKICHDEACSRHFGGSPHNISLNYNVSGEQPLNVSASSVTIYGVEDSASVPDPQSVLISSNRNINYFSSRLRQNQNIVWLDIDRAFVDSTETEYQNLQLDFNVINNLPAGTYQTTLFYSVIYEWLERSIDVTYVVQPNTISPSLTNVEFLLDNSQPLGAAPQNLTITSAGANEFSWTISSEADWLSFSHDSGTSDGVNSLDISVNENAGKLAVGTHMANIIISGNGTTYSLPVSITNALPTISSLFPNVVKTGSAQQILLTGENFTANTQLKIGEHLVEHIEFISPNIIKANVPVLDDGGHDVSIISEINMNFVAMQYHIVNHSSLPTGYAELDLYTEHLIYDELRNCVYSTQDNVIVKFTKDPNNPTEWFSETLTTSLDGDISLLNMTADHQYLIGTTYYGSTVVSVDLDSFSEYKTYAVPKENRIEQLVIYTNQKAILKVSGDIYTLDIENGVAEESEFSELIGENTSLLTVSADMTKLFTINDSAQEDFITVIDLQDKTSSELHLENNPLHSWSQISITANGKYITYNNDIFDSTGGVVIENSHNLLHAIPFSNNLFFGTDRGSRVRKVYSIGEDQGEHTITTSHTFDLYHDTNLAPTYFSNADGTMVFLLDAIYFARIIVNN